MIRFCVFWVLSLMSASSFSYSIKGYGELHQRLLEQHANSSYTRKDNGVVKSIQYLVLNNDTSRDILFSDLLSSTPITINFLLDSDVTHPVEYVVMVSVSQLISRKKATIDDVVNSPWERLSTFHDIRAIPFRNHVNSNLRINVDFDLSSDLSMLDGDGGLWIWGVAFDIYILNHKAEVIGYDFKVVLNDSVPFFEGPNYSEKDHGVIQAVPIN